MPGIPILLALLSSTLFGLAMVAIRVGLRHAGPLAGMTVSIPATALTFTLLAPLWLDGIPWRPAPLLIFAGVGLFFPALVTLLVFQSNRIMGPTLSSAVASTTPLFSVLSAALFLGERLTLPIAVGTGGIVAGIVALSAGRNDLRRSWPLLALGFPLSAAAVRGLAQTSAKYGLDLLPDAFLAAWIGYLASGLIVLGVSRVRHGRVFAARGVAQVRWFVAGGLCNGFAVLAMYEALRLGSVTVVTPIVATYPVLTLLLSAALLREEKIQPYGVLGVLLVVAGVLLVSR